LRELEKKSAYVRRSLLVRCAERQADVEEESVKKLAEKLDANNKRDNYEGIFPRCGRKVKDEATTNSKFSQP
jgi:hypothetical protein